MTQSVIRYNKLCDTIQRTMRFDPIRYDTIRHTIQWTMRCDPIRYDTIRHSIQWTIRCDAIRYDIIRHSIQRNMRCDAIRYVSIIQHISPFEIPVNIIIVLDSVVISHALVCRENGRRVLSTQHKGNII